MPDIVFGCEVGSVAGIDDLQPGPMDNGCCLQIREGLPALVTVRTGELHHHGSVGGPNPRTPCGFAEVRSPYIRTIETGGHSATAEVGAQSQRRKPDGEAHSREDSQTQTEFHLSSRSHSGAKSQSEKVHLTPNTDAGEPVERGQSNDYQHESPSRHLGDP